MKINLIYPSVSKSVRIESFLVYPLGIAVLAGITPSDIEINFYDDRIEDICNDPH